MKASYFFYLLLIPLFVLVTGCSESFFGGEKYTAVSNESLAINTEGRTNFIIENANGNIDIAASDTAKNIYCNITRIVKSHESDGDAKAHLSDLTINTSLSGNAIKIKAKPPRNDDRSYAANFKIIMPDNFDYNLSLGNGDISISASTRSLEINIGNGHARTDVLLKDNCAVSISVGNGSIDSQIPAGTNAIVDASVGNGSVSNNGLQIENQTRTGKTLDGTLGSGSGKIELSVGNGNITLHKK